MIRQSVVPNRAFDLSAMNNPLPPLNTLPQWTRVHAFDKNRYSKPFIKDQKASVNLFGGFKNNGEDDDILAATEMNPSQRIQYLERCIVFLKQQHSEMLHSLHEEIEKLKTENKDLQFKIVMSQKSSQSAFDEQERRKLQADGKQQMTTNADDMSSASSYSKLLDEPFKPGGSRKNDLKIVFLEEEIKELKHALRETRNKNQYLMQLLEQSEEQRRRQQGAFEALKYQVSQGVADLSEVPEQMKLDGQVVQIKGQPLNLQQSQALIKHLQQVNDQQSHELDRLKIDLKDVLYSHKWTPDAFLMARAYVAEDSIKEEEKRRSLPRIPLRTATRKLPEIAYIQDSTSLPPLRHTVGNKAIERRKRTQILQRTKLGPGTLLP
ncbi:unnamed protein product [Candidula unifasciata]|uniref:Uncharacterized protein n=1 Tax=Candidula unifasciata TaxID=100452 RepID=A0A8S4ACI4_9EUPU|nr:unnamed protein product [Candidula unifasciata]